MSSKQESVPECCQFDTVACKSDIEHRFIALNSGALVGSNEVLEALGAMVTESRITINKAEIFLKLDVKSESFPAIWLTHEECGS